MSSWSIEAWLDWTTLIRIAGCLAAGMALGVVYFHSLIETTRLFTSGGCARMAIALTIGRLILLGGALTFASLQGAQPLLAGAFGVLISRSWVTRRVLRAAP